MIQHIVLAIVVWLLQTAFGRYFLPFSLWFARSWQRTWTRWLPEELRERRVQQLESHLFDVEHDSREKLLRPSEIGMDIVIGTLRGMPGDLVELRANVSIDWIELAVSAVILCAKLLLWVILRLAPFLEKRTPALLTLAMAGFVAYWIYLMGYQGMPAAEALPIAVTQPGLVIGRLVLVYMSGIVVILGATMLLLAALWVRLLTMPEGERRAAAREYNARLGARVEHVLTPLLAPRATRAQETQARAGWRRRTRG
jgi:hypothetical protein